MLGLHDATWASAEGPSLWPLSARCSVLRAAVPHGHWKTTTFVAGLTTRGIIVPLVSIAFRSTGTAFETCLEKVLVPELRPGDIVIWTICLAYNGDHGCVSNR